MVSRTRRRPTLTWRDFWRRVQPLGPCPSKFSGGLKPSHLERLYIFLCKTSSVILSPSLAVSSSSNPKGHVSSEVLSTISNLLFDELHDKVEHMVSYGSMDISNFVLLLRCCLLMLPFIEFELPAISRRYWILAFLLKKSSNLDFKIPLWYNPKSGECSTCLKMSFAYNISHNCMLWLSVLEIFIHELLTHRALKKFFILPEHVTFRVDKEVCGNFDRLIIELVSAHFLLSTSDDCSLVGLFKSLEGIGLVDLQTTKLSLSTSLMLLHRFHRFSCPKMLLAHLVCLVSDCVAKKSVDLDHEIEDYTFIFEYSLKFYCKHMTCLHSEHTDQRDEDLHLNFRPAVYKKLKLHIARMVSLMQHQPYGGNSQSDYGAVSYLIALFDEQKQRLDESCSAKTVAAFKHIMRKILDIGSQMSNISWDVELNLEDACLLAAWLKLMSCSLFQIEHYIRKHEHSDSLNPYTSCWIFGHILKFITYFQEHRKHGIIRNFEVCVTPKHGRRNAQILQLLVHLFCCLCSFTTAPDFLKKSYICAAVSLIDIAVHQRRFFREFRPFLSFTEWSSLSDVLPNVRERGLEIANNYMKLHELLGSTETCNGESFINAQENPSELEEFIDFIVCRKGKDYHARKINKAKFIAGRNRKLQLQFLHSKMV